MSAPFPRAILGPSVFLCLVFAAAPLTFAQAAEEAASQSPAQADRESASARDVHQQNEVATQPEPGKVPIHIVPYGAPKAGPRKQSGPAGALSNKGQVQYWGGPVISNVHVVEVLWGNFVDSASTNGLEQFYTDILGSNYFGLLAEYSTVGLNGLGTGTPGSNQIVGPGVFDGPRIVISPATCPGASGNAQCTISDAQIQAEIVHQLNIHALPTPVQDNQGNFNTVYMIYFPPGVTITVAGHESCSLGGFCAYHSSVSGGLQPQVPYGVYPDFSQGGCSPLSGGCGHGTAFQNLTTASSHELAEAVTDVDVGTAFAPPLAWADQNTGEEIGDFCAGDQIPITVNTHPYTVQALMSNLQGGSCVSAPPRLIVLPATANAVPRSPFQVTVVAQASVGSQLPAYNDTVHFTSSDSTAVLPADYTFVPSADNGSHTFTVAFGASTTGMQTITATDTVIAAMTGSATVDSEHNPDLTVASTHTGSFTQSQTGATYTLTVSNVGDRPTNSSTVTVTENLPVLVAATGMSGTGWSCSAFTLICTRTDVLMNGQSYPPITLTVNLFSDTPPTITNTVTVAGGGELNTSNDTGSDPTTVIQLPDPVIFKSHVGNFTEGEIGESYTLSVHNFGFAPTSGTVTVVDTLPSGLTATAISGTGWSCTLGSLTCTRSDALAPGGVASYPPITLTVNVASSGLPSSVTNTATVSGGGEAPNPSNTATDLTLITQPASDLVVASAHTSDFTQGQTGAVYTLTVSNIGPLATTGQVTVNDNLPSVFTSTSMAGNGWTCSLGPPPTCTRSDSLSGNTGSGPGLYPPITLMVNVSASASTPQTNSAVVSGGGEANTGNDTSSDVTNIIQLPDLTVGQSTPLLAQDLTGANFVLTVINIGQAPTSGLVTLTDNLPASLTATAMSGQGWNCTVGTLTCTRSDVLGSMSSYSPVTLTVNVAGNAPSSVVNTATVAGGGEIITNNDTSTVTTPVLPPVSVSVFSSSATVNAGSPAQYLLTLNAPVPGQVATACTSGVPQGAACIISPTPLTAPFNGTVFVTVTTTPPGLAQHLPVRMPPVYAALMPFLGAAILLAGRRRNRSRRWSWLILWGALLLFVAGCGGGGSTGPPPPIPTPPGTYTITVTVTNAATNTQTTTPLTLIVK